MPARLRRNPISGSQQGSSTRGPKPAPLGAGARLQTFFAHLKCLLPLGLVERPLGVPKPSSPDVSEALAGEQVAESRIGSVWVDRAFSSPTL
jgi:hypothetical protein